VQQKQSQQQHSTSLSGECRLPETQIEEVARELGIDPSFVQQTLSREEAQHSEKLKSRAQHRTLARRRRWALPALLALLALLAIPTGQLAWLACLGLLPFLVFAFPPLKLHSGYWQFRCPKCDTIAGRYYRGAAASRGKRNLGKCPRCEALRWLIVEPEPPTAPFNPSV
jgi:phage FluMu protein Com